MLRTLTVTVAGLLTAALVKRLVDTMRAVEARAKPQPARDQRPTVHLRQDPATGVYYPEQ